MFLPTPPPPDGGTPHFVPLEKGRRAVRRERRTTWLLMAVALVAMLGVGLVGFLAGRQVETMSTKTETPTDTAHVDDLSNDGVLSEAEYLVYVDLINAKGYSALDRDTARQVGTAACAAAKASRTRYQFAAASAPALPSSLDPYEAGFDIGMLAVKMCRAEMARLGFVS